MHHYGLLAVYRNDDGEGAIKGFVSSQSDLGWMLMQIYREDPLEIIVAGSDDDEGAVRSMVALAVAEEIAIRRVFARQGIYGGGEVRSVVVEYDGVTVGPQEFFLAGESTRELAAKSLDAIANGAKNLLSVYQGESFEEACVEATRYVLQACGVIFSSGDVAASSF